MEGDNKLIYSAIDQIATFGTVPKEAVHLVDVGTKEYVKYFENEVLNNYISLGGATCKFFEGPYGAGKTHILHMIRHISYKNGMAVASTDLSEAISLSDWRSITEYILQNIEAIIDGVIVKSLPSILEAIGKKPISDDIIALKREALPCPGFKNAMILATKAKELNQGQKDLLSDFLMGRKVSVASFKEVGIYDVKRSLTKKNAEYILKTVLASLYILGFKGTTLLFDENERSLTTSSRGPSKENIIAANLMRRMIDGCSNGLMKGTIVVFAVLPGFLENCSRNYEALGQRLQIVRGGSQNFSWRCPVVTVESVNSIKQPEEFLAEAIKLYSGILKMKNGDIEGLEDQMQEYGLSVLERNVGSGYKRELMKGLANIVLERMED